MRVVKEVLEAQDLKPFEHYLEISSCIHFHYSLIGLRRGTERLALERYQDAG